MSPIDSQLATINARLTRVEALIDSIPQFNATLDSISATLTVVLTLMSQERADSDSPADPPGDFRVITRISGSARLVTNVAWPDLWSAKLFAREMLRTLAGSVLVEEGCRYWCEVWTPDETGELIDSAFPQDGGGSVEWESDLLNGT